jgi:hypothetical protein
MCSVSDQRPSMLLRFGLGGQAGASGGGGNVSKGGTGG